MEISQEFIDVVCRQTTYTPDESKQKLILYENDPVKVIQEYMALKKKENPKLYTNQKIYTEIRDFMKTSYEQRPQNLKL
jgi:hypothetical protein